MVVSLGLSVSACDGCNKSAPAAEAGVAEAGVAEAGAPGRADAGPIFGDGGKQAAPAQPGLLVPGATAALLPNMSIPDRFQVEAAARPPGLKVNVESVFAALEKA